LRDVPDAKLINKQLDAGLAGPVAIFLIAGLAMSRPRRPWERIIAAVDAGVVRRALPSVLLVFPTFAF